LKFFFIFFEFRISYLQTRSVFYYEIGKFRCLRNIQKLLLNSLSSRLRTIRDVVYENYQIFPASINSYDKLVLLFSLNFVFSLHFYDSFLLLKKNSNSFFFEIPDFYNRTSQILCILTIIPVLDSNIDKNCFFYRPYRNSHDIFYDVKSLFSKKISALWCCNLRIVDFNTDFTWLVKNFPFSKTVMYFWLNYLSIFPKKFWFSLFSKNNNIYVLLINFLFNGFVSNRKASYRCSISLCINYLNSLFL
jgi:hypothetical protein